MEPPELADAPEPDLQAPPVTAGSLARDAVLDLLAALAVGFGLIVLVAAAMAAAAWRSGDRESIELAGSGWGIAALLVATQLPLAYFGWRRRRLNRRLQRDMPALFGGEAGPAIRLGITAGLALTVASMLYTGLLQRVAGPDAVENQLAFLQRLLENRLLTALLVMVIAGLAPVCEEFFFRGVVFGNARAAGFSQTGVAVSAVLFAAVHVSPLLIPFYAAFAAMMCWLFARTGTLAAPIAAHVTLNAVACAALLIAGPEAV